MLQRPRVWNGEVGMFGGMGYHTAPEPQDVIIGTPGDDTLVGTNGDDTIYSNGGRDTITGNGGNDTIVVLAQLTEYGSMDGGTGTDTLQLEHAAAPISANDTNGTYSLNLASLDNPYGPTTLNSFERLVFNSMAGDVFNVSFAYGGNISGALNQIGPGLSATAQIVGGAGQDIVQLTFVTGNISGGVVTAPSFTFSNWTTPTRAYGPAGDRVAVTISGNGGTILNGSAHVGVQQLNGGAGSDTINGSNDMDYISGGRGGSDLLYGNGGDDTFSLLNFYFIENGIAGAETTRSGAASLFDGGNGSDFLMLGGNVNFQGTLQNIEGIFLSPAFSNANLGSPEIIVSSQYYTTATFSSQTLAALPFNLELDGTGTIVVNMGNGEEVFSAAGYTIDLGASVSLVVNGGDGIDVIKGLLGAANVIDGGGDTDVIRGGLISDIILGGAGDDKLFGLGGSDIFTGGAGSDQFRYGFLSDSGTGANADHITDFVPGSDFFNFLLFDADPNTAPRDPLTYIGNQAFHAAGTAELRYGTVGGDVRIEIDVNGDGVTDMHIVLDGIGGASLSAADFML